MVYPIFTESVTKRDEWPKCEARRSRSVVTAEPAHLEEPMRPLGQSQASVCREPLAAIPVGPRGGSGTDGGYVLGRPRSASCPPCCHAAQPRSSASAPGPEGRPGDTRRGPAAAVHGHCPRWRGPGRGHDPGRTLSSLLLVCSAFDCWAAARGLQPCGGASAAASTCSPRCRRTHL
jgi:hypothetical protein